MSFNNKDIHDEHLKKWVLEAFHDTHPPMFHARRMDKANGNMEEKLPLEIAHISTVDEDIMRKMSEALSEGGGYIGITNATALMKAFFYSGKGTQSESFQQVLEFLKAKPDTKGQNTEALDSLPQAVHEAHQLLEKDRKTAFYRISHALELSGDAKSGMDSATYLGLTNALTQVGNKVDAGIIDTLMVEFFRNGHRARDKVDFGKLIADIKGEPYVAPKPEIHLFR